AVSSDRGWLAVLMVDGAGAARRLAVRAEFGVKADRQFSFAFRPDGSLVTIVDDWVMAWRSRDGTLQRTLDLKTINPDLEAADPDTSGLFQLYWSPRDDRFAVSWGGGPMVTTMFDAAGHRLKPPARAAGGETELDFMASKVAFVDDGE